MAAIDPAQLIAQLQTAATAVIGKDVTTLKGFAADQLNAIAQQAVFVAAGIVDGSISGDTQDYFLKSLGEMARAFVNVLAGLIAVTAEEVWNAVVGALWAAINKATGLSLVVPG